MGMGTADCGCGCGGGGGGCDGEAGFPSNPATALNYHFGMLLGVEDLRAEQAFHIGQIERHHRELHGAGVVRGLGVVFDAAQGQLRVLPGFAIDQRGRAIEIARDQCLDLVTFVEQNRASHPMLAGVDQGVDLDLVITAGACLERPVQAIAPECNGASEDIAYSRLTERPGLSLVAVTGDAAPPDVLGTILAALEAGSYAPAADDAEGQALAALAQAARQPGADPALAGQIARAALLVASLASPNPWPEPRAEMPHVLLARLKGLRRRLNPVRIEIDAIETRRRPLLPPSWDQPIRQAWANPTPALPVQGPVVAMASLAGGVISIGFDRAVAAASLVAGAFEVLELTAGSLAPLGFALAPTGPAAAPTGASLTLAAAPTGRLRLVVKGTGPSPIVDEAFLALGQAPGLEGQNFTKVF